jgi:hypothetical protein
MTTTTIELSVCSDCLMVLANGADSIDVDSTVLHAITLGVESWGQDGYVLAADGEDLGFRWNSQCDVCGSTLGGDRFRAHALPV